MIKASREIACVIGVGRSGSQNSEAGTSGLRDTSTDETDEEKSA